MEIQIEKGLRRLTLIRDGAPPLVFPIALGKCPEGHKTHEGDGRTPEGEYYVCTKNEQSKFHLALGLSYPNPDDAQIALNNGSITPEQFSAILDSHNHMRRPPWDTPLGGFIMIHGGGIDGDWTAGCVALRNEDVETLFALCPMRTRVRIVP